MTLNLWPWRAVDHEFGGRLKNMNRTKQEWAQRVANALPRRVVYWALIRAWSHATTGPRYGTTDATAVPMDEVLRRWETKMELHR